MAEVAGSALMEAARRWVQVFPRAVFSGVVGDAYHTYGYHRSRNRLIATGRTGDYSIQLTADRQGDGDDCCALDMSMPLGDMITCSSRLLNSGRDRDDPRLDKFREFFGTLDGVDVIGWDFAKYQPSTSDNSHLWHNHVGWLRGFADDMSSVDDLMSVISGETVQQWRARHNPQPAVVTPQGEDEDSMQIRIPSFPLFDFKAYKAEDATIQEALKTWLDSDAAEVSQSLDPVNSGDAKNGPAWVSVTTGDKPIAFRCWTNSGHKDPYVFGVEEDGVWTDTIRLAPQSRWYHQFADGRTHVSFERRQYDDDDMCSAQVNAVVQSGPKRA